MSDTGELPLYILRPGFDGLLADRWREFAQDNPDLWHRYICLIYGVDIKPKSIILSQAQADKFIALTQLEEFQVLEGNS